MTSNGISQRWHLRSSEQRFLLILGDLLAGILALLIALFVWGTSSSEWLGFNLEFLRTRPPFWFYILPFLWLILMIELYDLKRAHKLMDTLKGIGLATILYATLYLIIYFSSEPNSLPRLGVAVFVGSIAILTLIWRMLYIRLFTAPNMMRRVMIIGAGKAGQTLVEVVSEQNPAPFNLIGLVDDDPQKLGTRVHDFEILGNSLSLNELIRTYKISDLILAISGELNNSMFQSILSAQEAGINLSTMSEIYEELLTRVPIFLLEADWIIRSFVEKISSSSFYNMLKRGMDLLGGVIGTILMLTFLPFIAIAILIESGKPVFYKQERLGRGGTPYILYKFRTMKRDAEKDGEVMLTSKKDPRVTRVGRILRKMHLDEFPQFFNVLQGNMSLVGPRAERAELVAKFQKEIPFYRARLLVKPGITGWAQINQAYAETSEEMAIKLEYDLYYIQHRNIFMDIMIVLRTIGNSLGFKGR